MLILLDFKEKDDYFQTLFPYFCFEIIFITFLQNFAHGKALFCLDFVLSFDNWIVLNFSKHKTIKMNECLSQGLPHITRATCIEF